MTHPVVFIGYSHKDKNEKDQLLTHLGVLQRAGLIQVWNDEQIKAGSNRVQEIRKAMIQAKLAILLISANFFNSDFIHDVEVQTLLKRSEEEKLVLFPLIAKPCAWRRIDWLADLSVRPKNGRPIWLRVDSPVDLDLSEIAEEIADIIERDANISPPNRPHEYQRSTMIYIRRDEVPALSQEHQSETIQNLSTLIGVPRREIEVHRITEGSIIFDLSIPAVGVERLRSKLRSHSKSLHDLKVERIILEQTSGKFEEWIIRRGSFHQLLSSEGYDINYLLNRGLDQGLSLVKYVEDLCREAKDHFLSDPEKAIELCWRALGGLRKVTSSESIDLDAPRYSRGKFHLLLASIYLNEDRDLKLAEKQFLESKNEFGSRKWFQLEALALLGLAITRRKLKDLDGARDASDNAVRSVSQEAIPESVDRTALEALRRAVDDVNSMILDLISQGRPDTEPAQEEKLLPLFDISAGNGFFGPGHRTGIKLLTLRDYQQQDFGNSQIVRIDLTKRPSAEHADYILSVNGNLEQVSDGLERGDWLLTQTANNLEHLTGKTVAILARNRSENEVQIQASLKTFSQAQDHYLLEASSRDLNNLSQAQDRYLLEAPSRGSKSIVIAHYDSDLTKINEYYGDDETVEIKHAYDVRISEVVIDRIPQQSIEDVVKDFLWQIPIISDIAAGIGVIDEEDIEEYRYLSQEQRNEANFGVRVVGNSMSGDDIFDQDIALIHQQPTVRNGEIAAIVIRTIGREDVGVLKRYYVVHERRENLRHWLLESSNPSSEHLVVIPSGADVEAIENMYVRQIDEGKLIAPIKAFQDSRIAIAGRFVGVVTEEGNNKEAVIA